MEFNFVPTTRLMVNHGIEGFFGFRGDSGILWDNGVGVGCFREDMA